MRRHPRHRGAVILPYHRAAVGDVGQGGLVEDYQELDRVGEGLAAPFGKEVALVLGRVSPVEDRRGSVRTNLRSIKIMPPKRPKSANGEWRKSRPPADRGV